mgnify:CR=1 FL=1
MQRSAVSDGGIEIEATTPVAGLNVDMNTQNDILYQDDKITITNTEITVKMYYFPIGTSRVIPLRSIKSFKAYRPRSMFQMKDWGMGIDLDTWWYCDFRRYSHPGHAVVIDTGSYPKIGLTPGSGDPDAVNRVQEVLRRFV